MFFRNVDSLIFTQSIERGVCVERAAPMASLPLHLFLVPAEWFYTGPVAVAAVTPLTRANHSFGSQAAKCLRCLELDEPT